MNGEFRLRVRYGKVERLRWLSHLEVLHTIERSIRRASLPYAVTQGFSPHMKIAFGPALPVGTAGEHEYYDVWLTRYTKAEEAVERLAAVTPGGLAPLEARYVGDREPSLTAALTIAQYRVDLTGEELSAEAIQAALDGVLKHGTLELQHKGKAKVYDLTRSIPKDPRVSVTGKTASIDLVVRMGPEGSLRPELFIRAALKQADIEPTAVSTTRLDILIDDGEGVWSRPV